MLRSIDSLLTLPNSRTSSNNIRLLCRENNHPLRQSVIRHHPLRQFGEILFLIYNRYLPSRG